MVVGTCSLVQKDQTSGISGCSHTVDAVRSGCSGHSRMVVCGGGTLSLVQKGQTSGFSGCSHTVDTVDAVHSGCSRIVVYGGGDIVFGAKRSNQWNQWMQSHSGHSTLCDCIH